VSLLPFYDPIASTLKLLEADLVGPEGPRISTMRTYRFALLQYDPASEYALRAGAAALSGRLLNRGWRVVPLSLEAILHARLAALPGGIESLARLEAHLFNASGSARARKWLSDKLVPLLEGPAGLAADVSRSIRTEAQGLDPDRTLVLLGRTGALYPFFRPSALLRHLDGHTDNFPVVLFYPGRREGQTSLSFLCAGNPDNDYRPRIYSDPGAAY
jgi:hypothetical protein